MQPNSTIARVKIKGRHIGMTLLDTDRLNYHAEIIRKEYQNFDPTEQGDRTGNRADSLEDWDHPLEFVNPSVLQIEHSYVTQFESLGKVSLEKGDEISTLSGDLQSPSLMDIDLSQKRFTEERFQGFLGNTLQKSSTAVVIPQSEVPKDDHDRKIPGAGDNAAIVGFTIQSGWSSTLLS